MSRRLVVGFGVLLLLGALLDTTAHRSASGGETLGAERRVVAAAADGPIDRSVPTLVGTADEWDGRYDLPLAIRAVVPGAVAIVDESLAQGRLDEIRLRAIGAVADVRIADLEPPGFDLGPPDRIGTSQEGEFAVWVEVGRVDAIGILRTGQRIDAIDVRLVDAWESAAATGGGIAPALAASDATSARAADDPPDLVRAIVLETGILVSLLLLGGLLLPRGSLRPASRVALAVPVGVAAHAALSLLRLPGWWGPVATVVAVGLLSLIRRRRGAVIGWARSDLLAAVLGIATIAGVVAWARWNAFLTLTPDSRDYWAGAAALADGNLAPPLLDIKRGSALQSLHAIGFAAGIEGLQALGAVLLVAVAALLVVTARDVAGRRWESRGLLAGGVIAGALILSPQVRTFAAYLNTHVLVGALLVVLIIAVAVHADRSSLPDRARPDGWLPVIAVLAAALVMSRAEGAFLVGLVLLGSLAVPSERAPDHRPWTVAGVATLLWAALLAAGSAQAGRGLPTAIVVLGVAGVALVVAPWVLQALPTAAHRSVPSAIVGVAWAAALPLMLIAPDIVFLDAVRANLGEGAGRWGVVGALLVVTAVVAVALTRGSDDPRAIVARTFVLGFVPLSLFVKLGDGLEADIGLATLLAGGGRVGFGDSVNRMWMHAVPVVLLLLMSGVTATSTERGPGRWTGGLAVSAGTVRILGAVLVAGVLATQWQPAHLPRTESSELVVERVGDVGSARPTEELVDGTVVEQLLVVPPFLVPSGTTPTEVCVDMRLVTFGRTATGSVLLTLEGGGLTAERTLRGERIADWGVEPICLPLDVGAARPLAPLDDLRLTVAASGAAPGAAAALLVAEGSGGTGANLRVGDDPVGSLRALPPIVLDLRIALEAPGPFVGRALDRTAMLLPWAAVLLGAFMLLGRRRPTLASFVRTHGDAARYLAENADVAGVGADPVAHWVARGLREGRRFPGIVVGATEGAGPTLPVEVDGRHVLLGADPDVALETAFERFVAEHADPDAYLAANPDVAEEGLDPIRHWLDDGLAQGRQLPGVDVRARPVADAAVVPDGWTRLRWRGEEVIVRPHQALPAGVVDAIHRQSRHEPALLAAGPGVIANLRHVDATSIHERDGLDLGALLRHIPARPSRVLLVDRSEDAGAVDADLVIVTGEYATMLDRTEPGVVHLRDHLRPGVEPDGTLLARLLAALRPDTIVVGDSRSGREAIGRSGRALAHHIRIDDGGAS